MKICVLKKIFGATLQDEDHVMVVYHKSSRERMEEIMGTDGHKIIEYGANGGETLQNLEKWRCTNSRYRTKRRNEKFRENMRDMIILLVSRKMEITKFMYPNIKQR